MKTALTVGEARAIATRWIDTSPLPFIAGFIGGSAAYADENSLHEPASDVDCYLVVEGSPPEGKIGKINISGLLLDVSWIPWATIEDAETDAIFASLLHFGQVISDKNGRLTAVKQEIDSNFHLPTQVAGRLESIRRKIRRGLPVDTINLAPPEQVMNWLFPATLATHIPLIAACVPLTVRKRFVAAKHVMAPAAYEGMLTLFGFDSVTHDQAQNWLNETATLFDSTTAIASGSKRPWASDIQQDARCIAIGGSQQLIDSGFHREALYWIIATSARCLVARADAEDNSGMFQASFEAMLDTMGLRQAESLSRRNQAILKWISS